jgi:hypothetical protein
MAEKKRAPKALADKCPQEIVITAVGVNEQFTYLDPTGNRHHAKVFWQALDPTTQYQISLPNPPAPLPFTKATGNGPFLTDPVTGRTITLTVDSKVNPGTTVYTYSVDVVPAAPVKGKRNMKMLQLAGGGIIIDG